MVYMYMWYRYIHWFIAYQSGLLIHWHAPMLYMQNYGFRVVYFVMEDTVQFRFAILPFQYFAILPFHHFTVWSFRHFAIPPFCRSAILSFHHFAMPSYRHDAYGFNTFSNKMEIALYYKEFVFFSYLSFFYGFLRYISNNDYSYILVYE